MRVWARNAHAIFLAKTLQQHHALGQHAFPGVATAIVKLGLAELGPLVRKPLTRVFTSEIGRDGLLECSSEDEIGTCVLLSPSFQVLVSISPWAGEVLIDLAVAVDHQATSGLAGRMTRCSQSV